MNQTTSVVENSTNPFLAPWGGLLPCNGRADCTSNHPLWNPFKALCEPLVGHSTLPGYYGYCRCTTWLFRHGEVCETLSSSATFYYVLEILVALPQITCCSVLLVKWWTMYSARYATRREALLNVNSVLMLTCCLSIFGQFMSEVVATYLYLAPTPQDAKHKFDVYLSLLLADILVFLQIPVFTTIASYTIISNQFFVMAGKWLKGAHITLFNPMLVVSTVLAIAAAAVWIAVTSSGTYYTFPIVYATIILLLGGYFAITIYRIILILRGHQRLQKWSDVLSSRLKVVIVCNLLTIVIHLLSLAATLLPKSLSDTKVEFTNFAKIFASFVLLLPLNGLLYFLLGVFRIADGTSASSNKGTSEPDTLRSLFQTAAERIRMSHADHDNNSNCTKRRWNTEVAQQPEIASSARHGIEEDIVTVC